MPRCDASSCAFSVSSGDVGRVPPRCWNPCPSLQVPRAGRLLKGVDLYRSQAHHAIPIGVSKHQRFVYESLLVEGHSMLGSILGPPIVGKSLLVWVGSPCLGSTSLHDYWNEDCRQHSVLVETIPVPSPQLLFKMSQIPSSRDHKAVNRCRSEEGAGTTSLLIATSEPPWIHSYHQKTCLHSASHRQILAFQAVALLATLLKTLNTLQAWNRFPSLSEMYLRYLAL